MEHTKNNALISGAAVGLGVEYGKNDEDTTLAHIMSDITSVLKHLGMITSTSHSSIRWHEKTRYYRVYDTFMKEDGLVLSDSICNYVPIKKGTVIGMRNSVPYRAKSTFVPVLFGKNRYKDIFGFVGKEIHPDGQQSAATCS